MSQVTTRALARCCARHDVVAAVCRVIAAGEAYALIAVSLLVCMTAAVGGLAAREKEKGNDKEKVEEESAADIIAGTRGAVSTLSSLLCSPVEQECRLRLLFLLRQMCLSPPASPSALYANRARTRVPSISVALEEVSRTNGVTRGCVRSIKEAVAGGAGGIETIELSFESSEDLHLRGY